MSQFYNPYNFIPLCDTDDADAQHDQYLYDNVRKGLSHVRHDCWTKDALSGRILCGIELLSPTLVGNQHQTCPGQETEVDAYTNVHGDYVLPSSSLRGMVSSVAESLSASAMRILDDEKYSVRAPMSNALSAIGVLIEHPDMGMHLLPLSLPTLPLGKRNKQSEKWDQWYALFKGYSLGDSLSAYVVDYSANQERSPEMRGQESFHLFHRAEFWYARLKPDLQTVNVPESYEMLSRFIEHGLAFPSKEKSQPQTIVGQKILEVQPLPGSDKRQNNSLPYDILSESHWGDLPEEEQGYYTRGVLMALGDGGLKDNMASTKKHERFIPLPAGKLEDFADRWLCVPDSVLEEFQQIAISTARRQPESKRQDTPFLPHGYAPNKNDEQGNPIRGLRSGDLVYFDIKDGEVSQLSYSSIWREGLEQKTKAFVQKGGGKNRLPWNPQRDYLTVAEALFGVVEEDHNGETASRNLAGRVRFNDASGCNIRCETEATVFKKLNSPKAPSPSLYFKQHPNSDRHTSTADRRTMTTVNQRSNGRKQYLPHSEAQTSQRTWASALDQTSSSDQRNRDLHMKGCPLEQGQRLYFHIDFDNLSPAELNLLMLSLKPTDGFVHRLGLGKPLGLGQIAVDPLAVLSVPRTTRYSKEGFLGPRYNLLWKSSEAAENLGLKRHYGEESAILADQGEADWLLDTSLIHKPSHNALCQLGHRASLQTDIAVCYPYLTTLGKGQVAGNESEGYEWFVANDHKNALDRHVMAGPDIENEWPYPVELCAVTQTRLSRALLKPLSADIDQKVLMLLKGENITDLKSVDRNALSAVLTDLCGQPLKGFELNRNIQRLSRSFTLSWKQMRKILGARSSREIHVRGTVFSIIKPQDKKQ